MLRAVLGDERRHPGIGLFGRTIALEQALADGAQDKDSKIQRLRAVWNHGHPDLGHSFLEDGCVSAACLRDADELYSQPPLSRRCCLRPTPPAGRAGCPRTQPARRGHLGQGDSHAGADSGTGIWPLGPSEGSYSLEQLYINQYPGGTTLPRGRTESLSSKRSLRVGVAQMLMRDSCQFQAIKLQL